MRFYVILLMAFALSELVLGDNAASLNEKGNEAFLKGDYKTALDFYQRAEIERPETPQLYYNHANASTEAGGFDEALKNYQRALNLADTSLQAQTYYNIGCNYFLQGDYAKAVDAYQKALELNPDDTDAKYNLELARKRLEEQKKQPQQKNNQGQQQNQRQQQPDKKQDKSQQPPEPQENQKGQEPPNQNQPELAQQDDKQQMSKEDALRILNSLKEDERPQKKTKRVILGRKDW